MASASTFNLTIANGATDSNVSPDLIDLAVLGFWIPAAITGTTLTLKAGKSQGATPASIRDKAGTAYTVTGYSAGDYIYFSPSDLVGVRWLQIVSGSAEGGARVFTFEVGPVLG